MTMSSNPTPEEQRLYDAELRQRAQATRNVLSRPLTFEIYGESYRGEPIIDTVRGDEARGWGWDVVDGEAASREAHPAGRDWEPCEPGYTLEPVDPDTLEAVKAVDRAAHRLAHLIRTGKLADILEELGVWTDACNALVDSYLP